MMDTLKATTITGELTNISKIITRFAFNLQLFPYLSMKIRDHTIELYRDPALRAVTDQLLLFPKNVLMTQRLYIPT